jgi:hypothetical protein
MFLIAHKKIRSRYALSLISNLSRIIYITGLGYFFGIWGIIFGKIISKITNTVVGYFIGQRA